MIETAVILTLLQSALVGAGTGMVYSIIFFAKKRMRKDNPEDFDRRRFMATVLVGAVVGAGYTLLGLPVTREAIVNTLAMYGGTIMLAEAVLKFVWRTLAGQGSDE